MDTRTLLAGVALLGLSLPALADEFTETFDGNTNTAGWTYGPTPTWLANAGNPGAHIITTVTAPAPRVRTTTPNNNFTGNYRDRNVSSFSVSLCTITTMNPGARNATLVLSSGSCEVYFKSLEFIPIMGAGWFTRLFDIDPHSPVMPAGWAVFPGSSCSDPNTAWNTVIENVTEISIYYGDPTAPYSSSQWFVGFDTARIVCADPWTDLAGGTPGVNGVPTLEGIGSLEDSTFFGVELTNGPPSEFILLWLSLSSAPINIFGGTIHAFPFTDQVLLATDPSGAFSGVTIFPPFVPAGTELWFQFLCQDTTTVFDITLSNGLKGTTP